MAQCLRRKSLIVAPCCFQKQTVTATKHLTPTYRRSKNASNKCPCDEHFYTTRMAIPPSMAIVSPVIKSWVASIAITSATSSGFPSR
jgi:hypothetical protein